MLLIGIVIYIDTPWGQNFVRGRAEAFLRGKLKTELHIGYLGYGFPRYVVLKDVLVKDQARDTLLSLGELKVDVDMLKLLRKQVVVQQVALAGVHAHVYRHLPDTTFNFTYIIDAFAGKPDTGKPKDTTSSSFSIALDRVSLDNIHIRYDDYTGGTLLGADLDRLRLSMHKLDLDKMLFDIKSLAVAGLQVSFRQDTSYLPPTPPTGETPPLQFMADELHFSNIVAAYSSKPGNMQMNVQLGDLLVQLNKFSLREQLVDVKKLSLANASYAMVMKSSTSASADSSTTDTSGANNWRVNAGDVALDKIQFRMDDAAMPRQPQGMDYAHLDVSDFSSRLANLHYSADSIYGELKQLQAKEKSGLVVKELHTKFNYGLHGAVLDGLYAETPATLLRDHLEVHYASLSDIAKHLGEMMLSINLAKSKVALSDVLLFAPDLIKQEVFRKNRNGIFLVDATMNGSVGDMLIGHFNASGLKNTIIEMNGRLSGLPDADKLNYDLHIGRFESSRDDIGTFVPDSLLTSVRIPDKVGLTGQVAGTIKDYKTSMMLATSDGLAYVRGSLAMSRGKGRERYDMSVRTSSLNIGRILRMDSTMGKITAAMAIKGIGFDPQQMTATADGTITEAQVKDYAYHAISLSGKIAGKQGNLDLLSDDVNARLQITGKADFTNKYPAATADIKIDSIDFRALKMYATDLRIHGVMHLDFSDLNPDYPAGSFVWWDPIITANGKRYYLDSMRIVSKPDGDSAQHIIASLPVMSAEVNGHMPLTRIGAVLQERLDRKYSPLRDSTRAPLITKDTTHLPANYDLMVKASVIDRPLLHSLLPGLTSFDSIRVDAALTPSYLRLRVNAPDIVYGSMSLQKGLVTVDGTDSAFTYKATADKIKAGGFSVWYADVHGNLDKARITTNISLQDSLKKTRFALLADMEQAGDSQIVHVEKGMVLDYKPWAVSEPNSIVLGNGGYYIRNLTLSNANESIVANSDRPSVAAPLKVSFHDFMLANITNIASSGDTLLADGLLNGNVTIQQQKPSLKMLADLTIQHLSVMGDSLGDMQAHVNNNDDGSLDAKVAIKGRGNDIALTGQYYTTPVNGNDFKFDLAVNALAVHNFESIAAHQIRNSSGYVRGKLALQGSFSAPQIDGELHTDNLVTTISQLNAMFKMPAEKIRFKGSTITMDNFTLSDSAGNKAVFTGDVNIENLADPALNLHIAANNWRALHSTQKDNKMFYGDLLLTANLDVNGSPSAPKVDGTIKVLKGTGMTIVNPESTPQIESAEGIVVFRNMKDTGRKNILVPHAQDTLKRRKVVAKGSDINVNVTVDKTAEFSLIIDQTSGDFLSVKGDAALNASLGPGGVLSLSGTYAVSSGTYQLNYNFIKRKFAMKNGSYIIFAGDPINGTTMDITATYETDAAPYDLVQRQVVDPVQLNYYKQRVPFDVDLHLKGPVMKPFISFDVEMPENKVYRLSSDQVELIQGKLSQVRQDTSELNKQVFALLILNRFVSDDPFNSGAGTSASFTALQSVSSFIGEQLNQAAGKLVKGVDFSVDLATTEDYTTGDMRRRTDLNLAASKRLLNDRLKLTIGNDFELEGPQTNNSNQSSYLPSDLAADYLLTADGRYTMRAYRKAYDEGVLQGYVTETGLNFIVSLDYNNFRTLFRKKKKQEPQRAAAAATSKRNALK